MLMAILRFEEEDDIYLVKVFFAYSQKLDSWGNIILPFLPEKKVTSPDRKMLKLQTYENLFPWLRAQKTVVEWRRLSRFPAKMTLAHASALLSIVKIEFSKPSTFESLKFYC